VQRTNAFNPNGREVVATNSAPATSRNRMRSKTVVVGKQKPFYRAIFTCLAGDCPRRFHPVHPKTGTRMSSATARSPSRPPFKCCLKRLTRRSVVCGQRLRSKTSQREKKLKMNDQRTFNKLPPFNWFPTGWKPIRGDRASSRADRRPGALR
jgi:hypothetical protein